MKYSIILPYYDRISQLEKTLSSFVYLYHHRQDFEVIIVEDPKHTEDQSEALEKLLYQFKAILRFVWVKSNARPCYNPSQSYNEGVSIASGKFIILSNPECRHEVDILKGMDSEFHKSKDQYVVCACVALKQNGSMHMWYQHSRHRDFRYHFCTGISKEHYEAINGFDERYLDGYGYDDNSFRDRVIKHGLYFSVRDDLLVTHLWHARVTPPDYKVRLERNKQLYKQDAQA